MIVTRHMWDKQRDNLALELINIEIISNMSLDICLVIVCNHTTYLTTQYIIHLIGKILDSENNYYKRRISEMLYIKEQTEEIKKDTQKSWTNPIESFYIRI